MPFYTFKCPSCCVEIEIQQPMNTNPPECSKCDIASSGIHVPIMERVWKPAGKPQFKGNGFYGEDSLEDNVGVTMSSVV